MTPEERARQIVERFNGITFSEGIGTGWLLSELAAQIAEAQREAARHNEFKSHLDEPFRCPDCFANGFRAAKAKAAG